MEPGGDARAGQQGQDWEASSGKQKFSKALVSCVWDLAEAGDNLLPAAKQLQGPFLAPLCNRFTTVETEAQGMEETGGRPQGHSVAALRISPLGLL